jgi:DNA-3-methyladenine glycosylase
VSNGRYLTRDFFRRDPLTCARELIGCELIWNASAGRIVETEAYTERGDEASHTAYRPSARAFIADHEPGAAYVYINYGMHWLLNVLVKGTVNGFVLIRALEPTRGIRAMEKRRVARARSPLVFSLHGLCSGPGKLTQALDVDGADHGRDLCAGGKIGFLPPAEPPKVETDIRIGISKAAHLPWRFLEAGSDFVSVHPRRPAGKTRTFSQKR